VAKHRVAAVADIVEGEGFSVTVEGHNIALFRLADGIRAVGNECPHMGAELSDGYLDGESVVCPWHGWVFSLKDGCSPFDEEARVPVYTVSVEGTDVFVEVSGPPPREGEE
jgi:nitrite reductase/ring-hydroxylating ferredoxin subunit